MTCLKTCPECGSKLENQSFVEYQYCKVCGYWTKKDTVRLEPFLILE